MPHDPVFDALMRQPVQNPVSATALDKLIATTTSQEAVPQAVLEQARHAQLIDAHNAAIDKRKAKKRQLQQIAREAGMSTAVLKRVLGRA